MVAPFTPAGSMAEADAITQEVRGQAIRSPVVRVVPVTLLRAVPAVRSPVILEAIRDMAIEARLYGAAAVGAAAAGAYGYYNNSYNNGCYQDTYGNWVCPNQYPY